ncbi:MAG TPA: ferric reductase-like transmembrane domain-containing protein [Acidimicrobiales bacterium]|nr:ferric reductase-like transmembrane domain-containing protein [Acidimicrobiales bacterium]
MIALTTPYLWYTTRATGMVTLILFTLVVTLGTLVANRVGGTVVGRFEVNELHRSVSLVALIFLALHITTTVVDSYVATGWISVLVPMTSAYRRVGVAVGAVAFDLILAVWISSLLKVRLKNETWRFIHWFSWLAFASAIVHALTTGTDAKKGVGLAIVAACAAIVLAAALWRYFNRPTRAAGRTALSPLAASKGPAPAAPRPVSTKASSSFPRSSAPGRSKRRR